MNRTILFSPVGGTDPISEYNWRDGSMLHICRYYRPDVVYLYMSKEILGFHKKDNRYLYCLQKLDELQDRQTQCKVIERDWLSNVQDFDFFYEEFRKEIRKISDTMDLSDTLLINVSSGTPAMKSGLLVWATLGEIPCKLIQVSTPAKKMNEHIHKEFDPELFWDGNEDNENGVNRCKEVSCPTLSLIKNEEIIKKHICSYDYSAAISVADTLPKEKTRNYYDLLRMAESRLLLDVDKVEEISGRQKDKKSQMRFLLNSFKKKRDRNLYEYALALDIKRRKKEYGDFIRSLSPIISELFKKILREQFQIDTDTYAQKGGKKWDNSKLAGSKIEKFLADGGCFLPLLFIYSSHLKIIIDKAILESGSGEYKDMSVIVDRLRTVEEKVRNEAAHEMVCITDEKIKVMTNGYDSAGVMKLIKRAFPYAGMDIEVDSTLWDSYDRMNELIMEKFQGS